MPPRFQESSYRLSFGGPMTPAVRTLIIVNVAIYILELFIRGAGGQESMDTFLRWFALNPDLVFRHLFVWQLVTYMFLHGIPLFHILFNMLVLWMFGCEIERVWGASRFTR